MAQECFWFYKQNGIEGQMFVREGSKSGEARALLLQDFEGDYTFLPATAQSETNKERAFQQDMELLKLVIEMKQSGVLQKDFDVEKFFIEVALPKRNIKNGGAYFKEIAEGMMPGMEMPTQQGPQQPPQQPPLLPMGEGPTPPPAEGQMMPPPGLV